LRTSLYLGHGRCPFAQGTASGAASPELRFAIEEQVGEGMSLRARGFTLIELLIVIVIVGILAAIAIPQFQYTRDRAFTATMKHDLKNLSTAQEAYFIDHQAYSGTTGGLTTGMKLSANVSITISNASATGFDAAATHARSAKTCSLAISASVKGTPTCP